MGKISEKSPRKLKNIKANKRQIQKKKVGAVVKQEAKVKIKLRRSERINKGDDDKKLDVIFGNSDVCTENNIRINDIRSGVRAIYEVIEKTTKKSELFKEEIPIFIQVFLIKLPKCGTRTVRLNLKNSLYNESSEICLITPDSDKKDRGNHEKSIQHYESLLREKGVTNIKVLPFNQLHTDYGQYVMKRKLVELYDLFLIDAMISKSAACHLGKIFFSKRKAPVPIKLNQPDLKEAIENGKKKTAMCISPYSYNYTIQVAHAQMKQTSTVENVVQICNELDKHLPGGWKNIRALYLKTPANIDVPIYFTMKLGADVVRPVLKEPVSKECKVVTGELSTMFDRPVTVFPSGDVYLARTLKHKSEKKVKANVENFKTRNQKVGGISNDRKKKQLKTEEGVKKKSKKLNVALSKSV